MWVEKTRHARITAIWWTQILIRRIDWEKTKEQGKRAPETLLLFRPKLIRLIGEKSKHNVVAMSSGEQANAKNPALRKV
jgi:hypothetical protein